MSDDDIENIIKAKQRRRSILSSDNSSDGSDYNQSRKETTKVVKTPRSSERLKRKAQQAHTIPKRKEKLEEICGGRNLTEEKGKNLSLSRRNIISDLMRGSSRYVTDKLQTFSSSDSSFSDFINDSEESETPEVTTSTGHHAMCTRQNKSRRLRRRHVKANVLTDSDSDGDMTQNIGRKRRKSKKPLKLSDEGSEVVEEDKSVDDANSVVVNGVKKKKSYLTSDEECEDDHQPVRSKRRTKSVQKEKNEKLLRKIVEKRKSKTTKTCVKDAQSDLSTDTELDKLCCRHENTEAMIKATLEEGESDREFIVNDDNNDNIYEFYDSLQIPDNDHQSDIITTDIISSIQNMNNFKRVTVISDSDDSDNEGLAIDIEMTHVYDVITQDNAVLLKDIIDANPTVMEKFITNKQTLLHFAAKKGCVKCMKYLVEAGCDRLALDSNNLTASAYAILNGHMACVTLLLQDVIDVHFLNKALQDQYKMTVFHFAIYGQLIVKDDKLNQLSTEISQCLLELFEFLFELDNWFCFTLLERKDKNGLTPLLAAVAFGKPECVTFLLKKGSHVSDFTFRNEGTLLHFAVDVFVNATSEKINTHKCCIPALLQSSQLLQVFIDTSDNSGFTPLMVAAESGNYTCVEVLLKYGASVLSKDKQCTTCLHLAAASGNTECVQLLISYGHKVDCLDKWGWPPILYANFAAQESCVLALMKPNPKQIFVLGDLLKKADSEAAIERNYKVVKDVLMAIANQDVYYRVFNDFIQKNPSFLEENDDGLLHETWRAILDFNNKKTWLKRKIFRIKQNNSYRLINGPSCIFNVCRENIFKSTMNRFKKFSGPDFRNISFDIKFENEEGVYLGPKREYFASIFKDLVSSSYQLFQVVDNNQYSLLPYSFFYDSFKKDLVEKEARVSGHCEDSSEDYVIGNLNKNEIIDDQFIANLDLDNLASTADLQSSRNEVKHDKERPSLTSSSAEKKMNGNLEYLELFGKLIGTAICQNAFLNCHLSKPLVKQILGIKVIHPDDLSYMDSELHKNLVGYILDAEDVEDLMLPCSFDVINPWTNQPCAVDMFSDDCEYLNNENKTKYVEMVSRYKLSLLFQKELDVLCRGLYQVIPKEFFSIFTADDFSLLINGVGKIDVDNWEKNTIYGHHDVTEYGVSQQKEITWFWEVVRELREEEKALLLKFSTGTPCVPAGGFAQLSEKFRIVVQGVHNKIPTASTCFNMLKLPIYDTKKDLKDKLLIAIRHGTEGFSFT